MRQFAKFRQSLRPDTHRTVVVDGNDTRRRVSKTKLRWLRRVLRDHSICQFKQLIDRTAVHYPKRAEAPMDVVQVLLSPRQASRLRVVVRCSDRDRLPSVTSLYKSANWSEREVWDRFGIPFEGHPDLRRLLTDQGFEGHPMRKEFPTEGYSQVAQDPATGQVAVQDVDRGQTSRFSQQKSAWKQRPERKRVTPD